MTTSYFIGDSSKTHYIKALPLNVGSWATGVVSATQNGTSGTFSVTTSDTVEYIVYEQQGGSPASTDIIVGQIGLNIAVTNQTALLAALAAIDDYIDTEIAAIKAKTDLIGSGAAQLGSQTVVNGEIVNPIVIADDYLAANGRAFEWTLPAPSGLSIGSCSCKFGGERSHKGSWLVTGTLADVGGGNWKLSFDLEAADTEECEPGCYAWSAAIIGPSGEQLTRAYGEVNLRESQTVE